MTRAEYMAPFISKEDSTERHRRYYAQYVNEGIKALVLHHITLPTLLGSKDEHLNDIQLHRWDNITHVLSAPTRAALKANGDSWSLGTGVCILKEAARQIIEEHRNQPKVG